MFRTVPLSIIRSFSLYTQQWYMSYRFADSLRAGSGKIWEIGASNWFYYKNALSAFSFVIVSLFSFISYLFIFLCLSLTLASLYRVYFPVFYTAFSFWINFPALFSSDFIPLLFKFPFFLVWAQNIFNFSYLLSYLLPRPVS